MGNRGMTIPLSPLCRGGTEWKLPTFNRSLNCCKAPRVATHSRGGTLSLDTPAIIHDCFLRIEKSAAKPEFVNLGARPGPSCLTISEKLRDRVGGRTPRRGAGGV